MTHFISVPPSPRVWPDAMLLQTPFSSDGSSTEEPSSSAEVPLQGSYYLSRTDDHHSAEHESGTILAYPFSNLIFPEDIGIKQEGPPASLQHYRPTRRHRRMSRTVVQTQRPKIQLDLNVKEQERLLLQLKDQELMPWKEIAAHFGPHTGRSHQVPALQMRYERLRDRLRVWTDEDVRV
ncbi:MAG: hypothetical protein M1816_004157 [Peltula sp. TS41687]|nr:MAG: hypothetical protein M1816_004157 [Peltula sp. TS41687]